MSEPGSKRILQRRWPWLTAAVLVFAAYLASFVELRIGDPDTRSVGNVDDIVGLSGRKDVNLLFVLIDTLRADHLGAYGYERDTSPAIDVLASRGVRFARHLSQSSWTKCSMASLWTGLYPVRSRVTRFNHVIPEDARLPAEILRDAGFRTVALYRNGWVAPYFGFGQGFDVYDRPVSRPIPPSLRRDNPTVKGGGSDDDAVAAAIEFLRINGEERWFLYLHLMDVHEYLYDETTALFGDGYADIYDNAIRRVDRVLDGLLGYLGQEGYLENTLIVVTSDHGEAFGEQGQEGHARYVYGATQEVPLVLGFPFRLEPGVVVDVRTANVDLWPTLLDLLGLPPLEATDGRSRVPEILAAVRGEPIPDDGTVAYAHLDRHWGQRNRSPLPAIAVAEGGFRYTTTAEGKKPALEELFDASGGPRAERDVLAEQPEVAARLRSLVQTYLEAPPPPWGAEAPPLEMDEMQLNQLRALGYAIP